MITTAIVVAIALAGLINQGGAGPNPTPIAPKCDATLWAHVFLPARLHVLNPCIETTGVITSIHKENDGDFHMHLKADNSSLINQDNIKFEHGDLILETICQHTPTRAEVDGACNNFNHPPMALPALSSHVTVVGSWVTDLRENGHNEIHPVTSITPS